MWPNIDRCLGLHQDVSVIYVVDGYDAVLLDCDGDEHVADGHGVTVKDAMDALDAALSNWVRVGRSLVWRSV